MTSRMERHRDAIEPHRLAIPNSLRRAREIFAIAQPHQVERFLRRQYRAMAGPRVIRMAMRDQRLVDGACRIDVKAADLAAQADGRWFQQLFGAHAPQICHIGGIANPGPRMLFLSSGDILADRRYEHALRYAERGDDAAAADLLAQAVELEPGFAAAWFRLGEVRARLGERDGAITAFRQGRGADPADRSGAALHLARLGAADAATAMSPDYLRALFDQYAPRFDDALANLSYRAPASLLRAVEATCGFENRPRFGTMLDLGCGTGLAGAAFRPYVDWLVGVDLAPKMIAQARAKGLYDRLVVGEIGRFLREQDDAAFHLIVAADVFVYLADLAPACGAIARVLSMGGLLAFTVETHEGAGVILGTKLRYAHGTEYVRAAIDGAGMTERQFVPTSTRTETGEPAPGPLVVAEKG